MDSITLSGRTERHLAEFGGCQVHAEVVTPLNQLIQDASAAGFDLALASGFRSFERQLLIWNEKAAGKRPVLADDGTPLDISSLMPEELMFAILRWSALPGASRHHWGTDMDIYDRRCMPEGYRVKLTLDETQGEGVFAAMHTWLDSYLAQSKIGFFRPYRRLLDGVAPEPWHLSYAPVAMHFQNAMTLETLRSVVASADIALKTEVLRHLEEIYERFVWVPWHLYPEVYRPC